MQMEDKVRKAIIFLFEVTIMTLMYIFMNNSGIHKYIVLSISCALILVVNHRRLNAVLEEKYLFFPVILYCGIGIVSLFLFGEMNDWTVKTIGFWMLPPIVSLTIGSIYKLDYKRMIDVQFYGSVLAYLIPVIEWLIYGGKGESTFAFVFGLYSIYYVWKHNILNTTISFVLMYYANKRIVFLAVIICLILMTFMSVVKYAKQWVYAVWSILIIGVGCYLYTIRSGYLKVFCDWARIDTKWRLYIYEKMFAQGADNYYIGQGIGAANELLSKALEFEPWLYAGYENPHNDLLKIFIELGSIGLIIFLISYLIVFKIAEKKITERALSQLFITFVYFILLMTTDNVSIYILFLVPMHSICLAVAGEKKENEHENHAK